MGAIEKYYDIKIIINQIIEADIDIALICHKSPKIEIAFEEILKKIKSSDKIMEKGKKSLERVLELKKYIDSDS